jgi:hypothetical protein
MSANRSFVRGDTVEILLTVYVDDVLTDPGATSFTIEEPDGTDNVQAATSVSTGVRSTTFVPDQQGYHRWKATGTAPAPFVREGTFYAYDDPYEAQPET